MPTEVRGVYRNGHVELAEAPPNSEGAEVTVIFGSEPARGFAPDLTREEIAELRARLASWDEDWNAPGMELYDAL